MATFKYGGPYRVSKAREKKVSYGRITCGTIPDRMTPKSAQSAQPNMLYPCLRKQRSKPGHFSIGAKPGSKCFDPDKFGTKISSSQIYKEKSYSRKTWFSTTPKTRFSRIKRARLMRASQKQFSWMRLRPIEVRAKFQPDRFSRSAQNVFQKRFWLVFLIYI